MDDNWVPIVAIVCMFGLPLGALIVSRVLAHRERMEMIRHGIYPPVGRSHAGRFAGAVPPISVEAMAAPPADADKLLRKGIGLAFIGVALTIGLSFIGYHPGASDEQFVFGPWLLGGLIPLFIGLSQVTLAFLTDPQIFARYRGVQTPRGGAGGPYYDPGSAGPAPGASGGFDQSYTYRPGDTQELRPPKPPPTRRP